jgi:MFS family permease
MLAHAPESAYAWQRLCISVLVGTIGAVGLWSAIVALPAVQAEFGVARASASLPYTATMLGAGVGGVLMGRLSDRLGIVPPILVGAISLGTGYAIASFTTDIWQFALVQGVAIGLLGSAAVFGPLIADISHWFTRNRGKAVAICASASYLAGTVWPPILEHAISAYGWRATHLGIGIFCVATMLPLSLALRTPAPVHLETTHTKALLIRDALRVSPNLVQVMLVVAGFACCVAMSMPQVHIVAYCGDLGYGPARGAEMLSMMLGFGVVSRLVSGWISDHIGGLLTLLAGSALQCLALVFYLPFNGLVSLYVVSALFGLSQGGIVPSYAMIIRLYFPAQEVGARFGVVLMATIFGMAAGGWMSGAIFDWTGSYQAAFLNGILWNLLNASIAVWLLRQHRAPMVHA